MKKVLFTVVAMMAFTFSFAETKSKNFDMSCDIYRLSTVLDLDERQMDAVEVIQDNFSTEMQALAKLKGPQQRFRIHQAVRKDVQQMQRVLNDKQFGTYMMLLGATLQNKHL